MAPMKNHDRSSASSVNRRRFIKTAGASGAIALTGLAGNAAAQENGTNGTAGTAGGDAVTLQWAASEEEASEQEAFNEALHTAGLPQNITVEFLTGGDVTGDRRNQYQQWLSAGRSTPSLLRVDNGWTIPFIAREQLLNLSENLPSEVTQRVTENYFDPAVSTAQGEDGNLYALPLWVGLPTMLYRKDLVESAGYDPEGNNWATEPLTWQRFSEVVADVKEQSDVDYGYVFQADAYAGLSCCNFNEFMTSWGGAYFGGEENLFGPIGDRPITINEEPVAQSIRMVRTFIHGQEDEHSLDEYTGNIAPEAVTNWTEQETNGAFQNGNAAFMRNWPFFVNLNGGSDNFGENLGVMPYPYGVSESEAAYEGAGGTNAKLGGWHLSINPNTEKLAATVEVIKAMTSDEFYLSIFEATGSTPPKPGLFTSDRAQEVDVMNRYLDTLQFQSENQFAPPINAVWDPQKSAIGQEFHACLNQQKSPEEAVAAAQEQVEQIEEQES